MIIRGLQILALCGLLLACTEDGSSRDDLGAATADTATSTTPDAQVDSELDSDSDDDLNATPPVQATMVVIDPTTGGGSSGVTITTMDDEATTDESGRATVNVVPGPYEVVLTKPGARPHRVFGVAGDQNFEQITYMSPDTITLFVFNSLGLTDDQNRGILVVGLDLPNLAPAVGAGATIDQPSNESFVFAGIQPAFASEIPPNGQGFLTFPNVDPGSVNVTVSYAPGTCRVFPAETEDVQVRITAGEVSVVAYTCRAE